MEMRDNMIRLIVCDLDGTLLRKDNTFDDESMKKIKEKMKMGVEFMFSTGRDFEMVKDFCIEQNIYSDMILNNGTQFRTYQGDTNYYYPMNRESFTKIIEILREYNYHISVHTQQGKYIFEDIESYFTRHIEMIKRTRHVKDVNELPKAAFFTREGFLRNTHQVKDVNELYESGALPLKIDARHLDIEMIAGIKGKLEVVPHLNISSSFGENIEITCDDSDKGMMLKKILEEKGLTIEEVATFGDGLNDISMLYNFPYSFAPANAGEEVKQKASFSLEKTNDEGAIKEGIDILEKLHLL